MAKNFDVFLSHNSSDKPAVEAIGQRLRERGLEPWLDKWELRPGLPWQDGLEEGLEISKAVAVFIGEEGLGPWEKPEMRAAIDRSTRESLPVIPVLLPGCVEKPALPTFLKAFTWVDLREGVGGDGIDSLVWGITGSKPTASEAPTFRPPALHNLPLNPLGALLKGRDKHLDKLRDDLAENPATAIVQPHALHGLGGIGKTRLAVEYAYRSGDRYNAAFFIRAGSPEELRRGLAELADLRLPGLPDLEGVDEQQAAATVLSWLRSNPGWLLILDNIDTEEAAVAVRELLPIAGGQVLLTSRLSRWPAEIRRREIDHLDRDAAVSFLLERTDPDRHHTEDDAEIASRLAELLGDLPLALEQAAAYIAANGMSFESYLDDWDRERSNVLEWYDESETEYPFSVAMTWNHSFARLGAPARTLLRLLAHMAADPVPVAMLESGEAVMGEGLKLLEEEQENAEDQSVDVRGGLAELARYSLLSRREDAVSVHRMVQEVVRGRIPEDRRSDWVELAVRLVNDFGPKDPDDVRTWYVWDRLRPHASRVIGLAKHAGVEQQTSTLVNQLAILLFSKSLYSQAEPLMRRALEIDERVVGKEHPRVANHLNNLAQLLQATNRFADAEPLIRRAVEIDEQTDDPEHPDLAAHLNTLASLLFETNRLEEAEQLMLRALEIDKRAFGNEHFNVARDPNNLGQLLQATNRFKDAEEVMRRTLAIDKKIFDRKHPRVAESLANLASLLRYKGCLGESEKLMRRAAEIFEENLGPEHPDLAVALNNLAGIWKAMGRFEEAENLYRRALKIGEDTFGPEHPKNAFRRNNLAQLLRAKGSLMKAEPLMRRALEIFTNSLGEDHPNTQTVQRNLDNLLDEINHDAD